MIQTPPLASESSSTKIGLIFAAPIVVVGNTWLPLPQFIVWAS